MGCIPTKPSDSFGEDSCNESHLQEHFFFESFQNDGASETEISKRSNVETSDEDGCSPKPFKNHPKYALGKGFNLGGEIIEWDSDNENSSRRFNSKKTSDVESEGFNSAPSEISKERKRKFLTIYGKSRQKARLPWQPDEVAALEQGMSLHGTKWAMILADHGPEGRVDQRLANRSQIQLKDKARNERQARERAGIPLGVFSLACSYS